MYKLDELKILVFTPNEFNFLINMYPDEPVYFSNYIYNYYPSIQITNIYFTNKYYVITYNQNILDKHINEFVRLQIETNLNNFNLLIDEKIISCGVIPINLLSNTNCFTNLNYSADTESICNDNYNSENENLKMEIDADSNSDSELNFDSDKCVYPSKKHMNITHISEYDVVIEDLDNMGIS